MIKNENTVSAFLNLKDPNGKPCPISAMDSFWVNRLRVLAMEGVDLKAVVALANRRAAAEKARLAQQKKKTEAYKKQQAERLQAAQELAEKQALEQLKEEKLAALRAKELPETAPVEELMVDAD